MEVQMRKLALYNLAVLHSTIELQCPHLHTLCDKGTCAHTLRDKRKAVAEAGKLGKDLLLLVSLHINSEVGAEEYVFGETEKAFIQSALGNMTVMWSSKHSHTLPDHQQPSFSTSTASPDKISTCTHVALWHFARHKGLSRA